jgi:hypothetical protein
MIIGFGLLFIAYALASFAIIQGLIFPYLAQGAPVAATVLLVVGSYGGGLTLLTTTVLVLYRSEATRRARIALGQRPAQRRRRVDRWHARRRRGNEPLPATAPRRAARPS